MPRSIHRFVLMATVGSFIFASASAATESAEVPEAAAAGGADTAADAPAPADAAADTAADAPAPAAADAAADTVADAPAATDAASDTAADAQAPAVPVEPADDSIRVVYADLDRYEQQVDGLHSGQSGSAKRILKLLDQTEGRLEASANKDHASWVAAEARLQALRARIDAWLATQ